MLKAIARWTSRSSSPRAGRADRRRCACGFRHAARRASAGIAHYQPDHLRREHSGCVRLPTTSACFQAAFHRTPGRGMHLPDGDINAAINCSTCIKYADASWLVERWPRIPRPARTRQGECSDLHPGLYGTFQTPESVMVLAYGRDKEATRPPLPCKAALEQNSPRPPRWRSRSRGRGRQRRPTPGGRSRPPRPVQKTARSPRPGRGSDFVHHCSTQSLGDAVEG